MEAIGACMNKLLCAKRVWCTGHDRDKYDPDRWQTLGEPA